MIGEQEADRLETSANGGSWWWRHKRQPEQPAPDERAAEAADEPTALREQLRPAKSKSKGESKGKCIGNNGAPATAGAQNEPPACELARAGNNGQLKEGGSSSSRRSHQEQQQQQQQQEQSSYSKIFSQYLPASRDANKQSEEDAKRQQHQRQQSDKPQTASRVVSALTRLSGRNKGNSFSSSSGSQFIAADQQQPLSVSNQAETQQQQQLQQKTQKANVKRKGFLYLKKPREATFDIVQRSGSRLVTKIRDLNNNSVGQSSNNYDKSDNSEYKARLIEDSDSDSDQNQEEYSSQKEQEQRQQESSTKMRPRRATEQQFSQKSDGPLLSAALFVAIGLLLLSLASTAFKPTTALQPPQAVPAPFSSSRSQQQPPSSLSAPNSGDVSSSSRPLPQPAAGSLVANVNCNKIRGHVTLTPNLQGGTSVSAQISAGPPGEFYQWSVHQFPVKPGAAMCSCSALILGSKLIDMSQLHGNLPSDQEQNVQSSINLFGPDSPVGHSLMLRGLKTGVVACATFLPTSRKSNYRAKFHAPLSGSVTIFQTAFGTSFTSHLMYSNGTRRHSVHQFDLVKSDDDIIATPLQPLLAPSGGRPTSAAEQSFEQLAQREHDNELNQCKRLLRGDASNEALLRNSTYQLSVSTENFGMRGRTSLVLPQIPFETFSSVYVVIYSEYNSNEPIACAPLRFVKPKQAAAKFQTVSVQGTVTFTQDSPYDVTLARINLNLPNSDGHSYGIDELPMIIRRKSDTRVCPNIREIIYNPHHVEPSSVPPEGEATSDQYAVGDLSGKYGSLTGKSSEKLQVNDYNLPLFGATSIIGRAMTIYSADGVAIACSNVELTTPMTTAFATFDFGIQGQFIFRQPANDCNGDTYVYIEVSKPVVSGASHQQQQQHQESPSRSLDHSWHIHTNPVDSGLDHLSSTDCAPAGGHYNPYNSSTGGIYSRDCTPFNVLRCELGDLSAKMFTIDIPPYRVKGGQEPDIGKFFGTDIDLPLCGPVSVVNRSVVVHVQDFGMQRLACSTVIEFRSRSSN